MVFEIGTAGESSWTEFLPEQSQGQEAFVRELLERSGFRNVRVIAESAAYHREVQRLLFAAEPAVHETLQTDETSREESGREAKGYIDQVFIQCGGPHRG